MSERDEQYFRHQSEGKQSITEENYQSLGFVPLPELVVSSPRVPDHPVTIVKDRLILSRHTPNKARFSPEEISAALMGEKRAAEVSLRERGERGPRFLIHTSQIAEIARTIAEAPPDARWTAAMPLINLTEKKLAALKLAAIPLSVRGDSELVKSRLHNIIYEAGITSRISSKYVVETYGMTGLDIDGIFCPGYIMEDLDEMPDQLNPLETARVMYRLASAVDYIHRRGFVHLDIKRDNVKARGNKPVLFDFGAAKSIKEPYRRIGAELSDQYADPQQFENTEATYNHLLERADIHALGMTAYIYLVNREDKLYLNGECDFRHESPDQILAPLPDEFPEQVYNVLAKATAYPREDRYSNAMHFFFDLRDALREAPGFYDGVSRF